MALIDEQGIAFVHWDQRAQIKIWAELSQSIIGKHGSGPFTTRESVEPVLRSCFAWTVVKFKELAATETSLSFYKALAGLYENSSHIQARVTRTKGPTKITSLDLANNRSSIRLALEAACEFELRRTADDTQLSRQQIELIEELLFVGMWAFSFSELIAMEIMIDGFNEIHIDPDQTIRTKKKHHYEQIIPHVLSEIGRLAAAAIVDTSGAVDLKAAIKRCLGLDYEQNSGLVPAYLGMSTQGYPLLRDVAFDRMMGDFASRSGVEEDMVRLFYSGLSLSNTSKENLEDIIYRPHSTKRHMVRPVLIWNVDGQQRAVLAPDKWAESIALMIVNAVQWGQVPEEWLKNPCFKTYVHSKEDVHDKLLEDPVEELLKQHGVPYSRNVKRLNAAKGPGTSVDTPGLGEIDFLYLNARENQLCVVDCKYLRRRNNMVGFARDYSNFMKDYEPKMTRKVDWYKANMKLVEEHFNVLNPEGKVDLSTYSMQGMFITNTSTYYSFSGRYRAYTIQEFKELIGGVLKETMFWIEGEDGSTFMIQRPFFAKPVVLDFGDLEFD